MSNSKDGKHWLVNGGEMGKLIREMDWSQTPLGDIQLWPESLKTTVSLCLSSNFPINLIWGPEHIQIINDGYWPICGEKYRQVMGSNYREAWASAWSAIGESFEQALQGNTSFLENQRMFLDRNGYLEETFFTFSVSPIRDDQGTIVGLFHPVTETTERMLAERRSQALRNLSAQVGMAKNAQDVFDIGFQSLKEAELDIQFAIGYEYDEAATLATIRAQVGLENYPEATPLHIDLQNDDPLWSLHKLAAKNSSFEVLEPLASAAGIVTHQYPETTRIALVLPLTRPGAKRAVGALIIGVSPRLPFNDMYRDFCGLVASAINTALANARAFEQEKKRAEELAALDLAKTTFFSNISHEFRTPLTLMLAPVEELLARADYDRFDSKLTDSLQIIHRNSLRLLKLVNTLLDFSRIEAGRMEANFVATDLGMLTEDLVSSFQSVTEAVGIRLEMQRDDLDVSLLIDQGMWENIVLNLVSNAFKYTLEGSIKVSLRDLGSSIELSVADTGTGIHKEDLPRLFERFYRVKGSEGRSYEGTGIGLSMVNELIKLHGGSLRVTSVKGEGSEFIASIPKNIASEKASKLSLQKDVNKSRTVKTFEAESELYAQSILPNLPQSGPASSQSDEQKKVILLVDDNPDMRNYIQHILEDQYTVRLAEDGVNALEEIRQSRPDLVLSDIMMPRMDGYGLLQAIRDDQDLRSLPVILVSARAGEEAKVEGLGSGADDYLTKPFSSRELKARVASHLSMAKVRKDSILRENQLIAEAHAAQRSNQLKDEFLATVSHELRTPMNAITGFSEILQFEEPGTEEFQVAVDAIIRNAKQQNRIVDDLLDISQIITGKLSLTSAPVNLRNVVAAAIETVILSAEAKGLKVETSFESNVPSIMGDAGRLQQVIWNVLSNSIRFSRKNGKIKISVQRDNDDALIRVEDDGEGMNAEFLPFALDSLRQEDGSLVRKHGGLGLGLSIVKQIVEAHGGKVSVQSQGKMQGTTIVLSLPGIKAQTLSSPRPSVRPEPRLLEGLHILAIDDDSDARLLVKTILGKAGALAKTASSAAEAYAMLETYTPDVIISDIGMPEENGYQLLTRVRAMGGSSSQVPAMALTAWAREEDRNEALQAGFQDHLAKPVRAKDLEKMVVRLASLKGVELHH